MSYTVRGMCGDSAKVEEAFASLEEARVLFEQLKTSDRYSSVELDDITDPDNPDMVDIVELGGGEEEEEEEEEEEKEEEWMCKNCDPSYKGRKDLFCIRADGGDCGMGLPHYQPPMEAAIKERVVGGYDDLRGIIEAQAAYIAELDTAIAAAKANLAALRTLNITRCVCGKQLRGMFRTSGQGLCAKCQPSTCTEEGCGAKLFKSWRFVAKCRVHGGREGV